MDNEQRAESAVSNESHEAARPPKTGTVGQVSGSARQEVVSTDEQKPKKRTKLWVKVLLILILVLGLVGAVAAYIGFQAKAFYEKALSFQPTVEKIQGNFKSQDLPALKTSLEAFHSQVADLEKSYRQFTWAGALPVAGLYVKDGERAFKAGLAGIEAGQLLVDAIEPYADVLGFHGSGSFTGGTAEDRMVTILGTLDKITPKLDDIAAKLKVVDENLNAIDASRYPYSVKGKLLSDQLKKLKDAVHTATEAVTDAKPALTALPKLAGMEEEKKYLVLFHNDGELRGTGGFMTAYAVLRVDKGRVTPEQSSDIYDLDSKFKERLQPPDPIKKYLKNVPYWYLRDMNLSPDFKDNMDLFTSYAAKIPSFPKIDGVVGVDTNILVEILKIFGAVDVPGFGRFTAENDPRCDCPQVVYQLELIADRPVATLVESRKGVLGPLMHELVTKVYGSPKAWWDDLLRAFVAGANEKHLVFYFHDDEFQKAAENLNVAGRVGDKPGDYLLITDVNFGGAKANFFVEQDVTGQLTVGSDGSLTRTLTVTYTNPAPASNCNLEAGQLCLNAPLPDYIRIYVPKGSTLVESVGLDEPAKTTEDLGKTVFEGFVKINPKSTTKTIYTYKLPFKKDHVQDLLVQKQVGKEVSHYKVELPDRVEEFDLDTDKAFNVR